MENNDNVATDIRNSNGGSNSPNDAELCSFATQDLFR